MDRLALCAALAPFANQELTLEVARAIVTQLCAPTPLDLSRFAPRACGPFTIQCEPFGAIAGELHPLHAAHWQETEGYRHAVGLDVDYDGMRAMEEQGRLLQVTLRTGDTAQLVGHLRMYVHRSLHTQQLYAEEDCIFIAADYRGHGMTGVAMGRYAEECLRTLGVSELRFTTKHAKKAASAMLQRLRYEPVATQWVKILKREGARDVQ